MRLFIFLFVLSFSVLADGNYNNYKYYVQGKAIGLASALAANGQQCEFDTYLGQWFAGVAETEEANGQALGLCLRPKGSRLLFVGGMGNEEGIEPSFYFGVNGRFK